SDQRTTGIGEKNGNRTAEECNPKEYPQFSVLFFPREEEQYGDGHVERQAEIVVVCNKRIRRTPDAELSACEDAENSSFDRKEAKAKSRHDQKVAKFFFGGHQQDCKKGGEHDLADLDHPDFGIEQMVKKRRLEVGVCERNCHPQPKKHQQQSFAGYELVVSVLRKDRTDHRGENNHLRDRKGDREGIAEAVWVEVRDPGGHEHADVWHED